RVGACCPVGLDTEETAASLRAGVSRKTETGFLDRQNAPIVVGHVGGEYLPQLKPQLLASRPSVLQRRLLRLSSSPLREVCGSYPVTAAPPLYLAVPQAAPGEAEIVSGQLVAQLVTQTEQAVDVGASRMFSIGRAGLFTAVAA